MDCDFLIETMEGMVHSQITVVSCATCFLHKPFFAGARSGRRLYCSKSCSWGAMAYFAIHFYEDVISLLNQETFDSPNACTRYVLADQTLGEKIEPTKSPGTCVCILSQKESLFIISLGLGLPRDSFKERQSEKSQPFNEVSRFLANCFRINNESLSNRLRRMWEAHPAELHK